MTRVERLGGRADVRPGVRSYAGFALQLALIGVLATAFEDFAWAVRNSGTLFVWSWVLGGILQLSVALSLAELWSAYPGAARQHSWLRRVGGSAVAWLVGYLLLGGYLAALADTDFRLAGYLLPFAGITPYTTTQRVAVAVACLCLQTTVSFLSVRTVVRGIAMAVAVQLVGIVGIVLGLALLGLRRSSAFLFTAQATHVHEHLSPFLLMLLIPASTLAGFDAIRNVGEERSDASRTAPGGVMIATLLAFLLGLALFVIPLLAMNDPAGGKGTPPSLLDLLQTRLGAGTLMVYETILVTTLMCRSVVLHVAAARLLQAQARGSGRMAAWLSQVSTRGVPGRATLLCGLVAAILCLAWPMLSALETLWPALWALAYGGTIALMLSRKLKRRPLQGGWWSLGKWGTANNVLAICWSVFLALLLPLIDVRGAVPLFVTIVLVGALVSFLWPRPRGV